MSDYQARLKLARDAYQATQPDLAEVNAGVARVGSQLAPQATQLRRLFHLLGGGALLAGLGLLGDAALSQGSLAPDSQAPKAQSPTTQLPEMQPHGARHPIQTQPAGWLVPVAAGSAAEADAIAADPISGAVRAPAQPGDGPGVNPALASAPKTPDPSWAAVSGALERGDAQAASGILAALASSQDASTRAKALLGQAQIHLSKGERAEAKRLAAAAASVPGASEAIRMKAVRWAARASL